MGRLLSVGGQRHPFLLGRCKRHCGTAVPSERSAVPVKGYIALARACAGAVETPFQYMSCPILIHRQYCAAPRAINCIADENGVRVVRQVMGICEIAK